MNDYLIINGQLVKREDYYKQKNAQREKEKLRERIINEIEEECQCPYCKKNSLMEVEDIDDDADDEIFLFRCTSCNDFFEFDRNKSLIDDDE